VKPIPLSHIWRVHRQIEPYIRHTPLIRSAYLSERSGADVWLKLECRQPTGSFKVRGALSKLTRLTAEDRTRGTTQTRIVAASAGNHALGIAHAVASLQQARPTPIAVDIFVPNTIPRAKLTRLRRYPIHLHLAGESYESAHQAAAEHAYRTGAIEIPAYDDLDVVTGQATAGLEIVYDLPHVDAIIVPVGGGGLIAGIAQAVHHLQPECRIIGMQPAASPAALLSLRDGVAYDPYDHEPTLADGLAGGFGRFPLALSGNLIESIHLATEQQLRRAIYTLAAREQLIVEASGAIAIVPLLENMVDLNGRSVVCVLTGSNLDPAVLRDALVEFVGSGSKR
jgi:threonine dehydratase